MYLQTKLCHYQQQVIQTNKTNASPSCHLSTLSPKIEVHLSKKQIDIINKTGLHQTKNYADTSQSAGA